MCAAVVKLIKFYDGCFLILLLLYVLLPKHNGIPYSRRDFVHVRVSICGRILRDYWTTNRDDVCVDYRNGVFLVVTNKLW
jgi:hypothetical protein